MRIGTQTQTQTVDSNTVANNSKFISIQNNESFNNSSESISQLVVEKATIVDEEQEISNDMLRQAVDVVNDFLGINNSSSKFVFHEGLERYYVTVVNRDTNEVIKEIPPKKLLDAFYEMQKMVGMIVDEKI